MDLPFLRRKDPGVLGWFGKLPSVGDFVGRGLPPDLREQIHTWFADGLSALAAKWDEDWRDAYRLAPVWHFAMNAGVWDARALMGCVAPSMDRVGRCSPVIVLRSVAAGELDAALPPRSGWLYDADALLRRTIAQPCAVESILDALQAAVSSSLQAAAACSSAAGILADLGISDNCDMPGWFSWPDLPARFNERRKRSFWWAEPSPKQPPRQVIHNGDPDAELFELLMCSGGRR